MAVRKTKGSWWVDFSIRNNRYRYRSPENTKAGAELFEASLRRAIAQGEDINKLLHRPSTLKFKDYCWKWYETYVIPNNKATERLTKKGHLKNHVIPHFGEMNLENIGPKQLEEYKSRKSAAGYTAKTINNQLSTLSKSLRTASDWGYIEKAPKILQMRVPPQKFDFLTPQESNELVNAMPTSNSKAMALTAIRTGMRFGELAGLTWNNVNLDRRIITVAQSCNDGRIDSPKNNRIRYIPISADLFRLFLELEQDYDYVFHLGDKKPIRRYQGNKLLKQALKVAGLRKIGWHTLRHTFASQLVMAKIQLPAIQQLMGHATIQMTMRYAHIQPSVLIGAVDSLMSLESVENENIRQPAVNQVNI